MKVKNKLLTTILISLYILSTNVNAIPGKKITNPNEIVKIAEDLVEQAKNKEFLEEAIWVSKQTEPFFAAVIMENKTIIQHFLDKGVDPNVKSVITQKTVLQMFEEDSDEKVVKLLKKYGAK